MSSPISIIKITGLIMLILALAACSQSESPYKKLSPQEFEAKLNTTDNAQIIDVRSPAEYLARHLKNAVNINFTDKDFKEQISGLDIKRPVFVHCAEGKRGGRSNKTAKMLEELGFNEIYELEGGLNNWIEAGLETVK